MTKCDANAKICFGKGRKHCGKRRKCWSPAFCPFPTMFSKGYFFRVVISLDCMVKSLKDRGYLEKSTNFWSQAVFPYPTTISSA